MKSTKSSTKPVKTSSTNAITTSANNSSAVAKKDSDSDSESSYSEQSSESSSSDESFATCKARLLDGYWCNDCKNWVDGPFSCTRCLENQGLLGYNTDEEEEESDDENCDGKTGYRCYYCDTLVDAGDICDCVVYREMEENKEQRRMIRKLDREARERNDPPKRGTKITVWRNPNVKKRLATIDKSQLKKIQDESE